MCLNEVRLERRPGIFVLRLGAQGPAVFLKLTIFRDEACPPCSRSQHTRSASYRGFQVVRQDCRSPRASYRSPPGPLPIFARSAHRGG